MSDPYNRVGGAAPLARSSRTPLPGAAPCKVTRPAEMLTTTDLTGFDVAWIAVDAAGFVAIFTNAGEGPIPESAEYAVFATEELVLDLPEISEIQLHADVPRPDSFVAFAKRGLFSYDWSDAHRTASLFGGYELVARPDRPLSVEELPSILQAYALATRLNDAKFGAAVVVVPS